VAATTQVRALNLACTMLSFLLATELILRQFYAETQGASWTSQCVTSTEGCWLSPGTQYCQWLGVGCDTDNVTVISLILPNNHLTGTPSSLGNLTSLRTIDVSSNVHLSFMDLPPSWHSLGELLSLDLSYTWVMFDNFDWAPKLRNLSLRGIAFVPFLQKLPYLERLDLSEHESDVPKEITSLRFLKTFIMRDCSFVYRSNLAPLEGLSLLEYLDLSLSPEYGRAEFSGYEHTTALSNLTNLQYLDLSKGSYPNAPSNADLLTQLLPLTQLRTLRLAGLSLNSTFPDTFFTSLTNLETLDLHYTGLQGEIPSNIDQATNLTQLLLQENSLTGTIPPIITSLSLLRELNLTQNRLNGPIPPLSNFVFMEYLSLARNSLNGSIPESVTNLTELKTLNLHSNQLVGEIPKQMLALDKLRILRLANNKLTGLLPSQLTLLFRHGDLQYLDVSNNLLSGNLPLTVLSDADIHLVFPYLRT